MARTGLRLLAIILAVMIPAIALVGCTSTMASMMAHYSFTHAPANPRILIHPDPKVGDYAVYEMNSHVVGTYYYENVSASQTNPQVLDASDTALHRYEVIAVDGVIATVRITMSYQSKLMSSIEDYAFEYHVDKDGYTKDAYVIEKSGKRTRLEVASKGTQSYFDYKTVIPEKNSAQWSGRELGGVGLFSSLQDTNGKETGRVTLSSLHLVSNDVKFRIIKTISKLSSAKTVQVYAGESEYFYNFTDKTEFSEGGSVTRLIEDGNVKTGEKHEYYGKVNVIIDQLGAEPTESLSASSSGVTPPPAPEPPAARDGSSPEMAVVLARRTVKLNGKPESWAGVEPLMTMGMGSLPTMLESSDYSIKSLSACRDEKYLYWKIEYLKSNPVASASSKLGKKYSARIACAIDSASHLEAGINLNMAKRRLEYYSGIWDSSEGWKPLEGGTYGRSDRASCEGSISLKLLRSYCPDVFELYAIATKFGNDGSTESTLSRKIYIDLGN
jgi:hypothetical protein